VVRSANSIVGGNSPFTIDTGNLADDSVFVFDFEQELVGQMILSSNSDFIGRGIFAFRASATSPFLVNITKVNTLNLSTGALTGTTGADSAVNVSVDVNGKFYIENRTGATRRFVLSVLPALFY
jgi:hypothetical protein